GLRARRDRDRAQARAGLRPFDRAAAAEPAGALPERHLHRARHLARAAGHPVPGAVRPSRRGDGAMTLVEDIVVKKLGQVAYGPTLDRMRAFTHARDASTADEIWLLEHPPVYTLGQGADARAVANNIPVVRTDRGGDITYHGPGQIVLYALVDLARRG